VKYAKVNHLFVKFQYKSPVIDMLQKLFRNQYTLITHDYVTNYGTGYIFIHS